MTRRFSFRDAFVLLAGTLCMAGAAWLFWEDLRASIRHSGENSIGTITFKRRNAQRKYADRVVWETIDRSQPVFPQDSIRTVEDSGAVVRLVDGTEITLDEKTLITLEWGADRKAISFLEGNITAKRETANAADEGEILIRSNDAAISLGKAEVNLGKDRSGNLALAVEKGEVKLKTGGDEKKVTSSETAVVDAATAKATVKAPSLLPESPGANAFYVTHGDDLETSFVWKRKAAGFPVVVEISESSDFSKIIRAEKSDGVSIGIVLQPGTFFWRLREEGGETTLSRKLTILKDPPLTAISPREGTGYSYRTEKPLIRYIWESSDIATEYEYEIARDRGMKDVAGSGRTDRESVSLDILGEGTYFWRVRPYYGFGGIGISGSSQIQSFTITRIEELRPAKPLSPREGEELGGFTVREKGVLFNWEQDRDVVNSLVVIGRDRDLKEPLRSYEAAGNFFTLRRDLEPGAWFWRVQGKAKDGTAAPPSGIASFVVKEAKAAVTPLGPKDGWRFDQKEAGSIAFTWSADAPGKFVFRLAKDRSMVPAISETVLEKASISPAALPPGDYFWQVSLVADDGTPRAAGPVSAFSVLPGLAAPELTDPKPGSNLKLVNADSLGFGWTAVPGADRYRFRLLGAGGDKPIAEATSESPAFILRDPLSIGKGTFTWSVVASVGETPLSAAREGNEAKASFSVSEAKRIAAMEARQPREGEVIEGLASLRNGVVFRWTPPAGERGTAVFSLGRDRDLSNPSKTIETAGREIRVDGLDAGLWFWKVGGRTSDGLEIPASESRSFRIAAVPPLGRPVPISPAQGSRVDMTGRKSLPLSWSGVPEASHYVISLVEKKTGRKVFAERTVRETSLVFDRLEALDEGTFRLTIRAVSVDGRGRIERTSEAAADFDIVLSARPSRPDLISPRIQYVD